MSIYDNILSANESAEFEKQYFLHSKKNELAVIRAVGEAITKDFLCEKYFHGKINSLLLVLGKGHNASDGLAFLLSLKEELREAKIYVAECFSRQDLRENTELLLKELCEKGLDLSFVDIAEVSQLKKVDIVVEAIAGMRSKPELSENFKSLLITLNAMTARAKISMDMPFGISDFKVDIAFKSDYTYATAIAKSEIFLDCNADFVGWIRYVDMGFFEQEKESNYCIYAKKNLDFFHTPRRAFSDKRDYGFLLVVGGSMEYKGAVLLNVQSALRSSVGLLRAFVPEALEVAYACKEPTAMYTGCTSCEEGACP